MRRRVCWCRGQLAVLHLLSAASAKARQDTQRPRAGLRQQQLDGHQAAVAVAPHLAAALCRDQRGCLLAPRRIQIVARPPGRHDAAAIGVVGLHHLRVLGVHAWQDAEGARMLRERPACGVEEWKCAHRWVQQ
jgi:hypothetical protein